MNAVAVLVMRAWRKNNLKEIKTATTVQFETDSFNYTRMKIEANPSTRPPLQHLTDDSSSFYITGENAEEIANLCSTVIKVTQLVLDLKFKFNKFSKVNALDIKAWDPNFFKNFFLSNHLVILLGSIDDFIQREGNEDGFSTYYRDRNWIAKAPETKAGHIYVAYFQFLGELYLYIGINESATSDNEILAMCHINNYRTDKTALGEFIRDKKEKYPEMTIDVKGKRLVCCATNSTACIVAALFGSEEDIFLDENHQGKFKLLNKTVEIEEITQPFLKATRYVTYKLFKKRLNISHDGEETFHVITAAVEDCFENVTRMSLN